MRLAVLAVHEVGELVHAPGEVAAPGGQPLPAAVEAERAPTAPRRGRARSTVSRTASASCTGKTPTTAPVAGSVDSKVCVVACRSTVPAESCGDRVQLLAERHGDGGYPRVTARRDESPARDGGAARPDHGPDRLRPSLAAPAVPRGEVGDQVEAEAAERRDRGPARARAARRVEESLTADQPARRPGGSAPSPPAGRRAEGVGGQLVGDQHQPLRPVLALGMRDGRAAGEASVRSRARRRAELAQGVQLLAPDSG